MSEGVFYLRSIDGKRLTCRGYTLSLEDEIDNERQHIRIRDHMDAYYIFFDKNFQFKKDPYLTAVGLSVKATSYFEKQQSHWYIIPIARKPKFGGQPLSPAIERNERIWHAIPHDRDISLDYPSWKENTLMCAIMSKSDTNKFLGFKDGKLMLMDMDDNYNNNILFFLECNDKRLSIWEKISLGLTFTSVVISVIPVVAAFSLWMKGVAGGAAAGASMARGAVTGGGAAVAAAESVAIEVVEVGAAAATAGTAAAIAINTTKVLASVIKPASATAAVLLVIAIGSGKAGKSSVITKEQIQWATEVSEKLHGIAERHVVIKPL